MSRRYGWIVLFVAAAAMVGSLPGRTQGLGLVTEPLLAELRIDRVSYATLNLWATLLGSAGALGVGYAVDRRGSRVVLTGVLVSLGAVVCFMSRADSYVALAVWITLTRALGQSALSVVSLAIVGHWFVRRIDKAMAIYSVAISVGFMTASLNAFNGVMRAFLDALILTSSPVWGLRPRRAARSTLANLAKPVMVMDSPLAVTAVTTSVKPRTAWSTTFTSTPVCAAIATTSCRRFTMFLQGSVLRRLAVANYSMMSPGHRVGDGACRTRCGTRASGCR